MVKIALVMLAYEIEPVMLAVKNIKEKLNVDIEVCPRTTQDLLDSNNLTNFISFAQTSNAVIVHIMGGRTNFPGFDQAIAPLRGFHVPVFTADIQSDPEVMAASTLDKNDYQTIYQYLKNGCVENFENLILFLANRFAGGNFELSPPKAMLIEGIYHPKLGNVPTLSEYIEKNSMSKELTVGILFNDPLKTNDVAFADSLIESIESQGANALMVFLSSTDPSAKNLKWVFENYFMKNGKPVVDVVISTLAHSLAVFMPNSEPATNLFKELNVPVLKAIATYNTFEQWRDSMLGLTYSEVAWNVAMPEFDGLIITVPIAARWLSETDPITGSKITLNKPIPERLEKLVRLSINWAKLRHIPNSEKKVAIIFHNYPPKNDTIGHAAGLDSAASVMNLLRDFQKQGYTLEGLPENGQKLMAEVINGLTNDRRWLSADELSERAIDKIPKEQYTHWFSELPVEPQEMILKHWGKPPGAIFNYKSNLLVPGILNGNVFIGMQPPRGKLEDPAAIYHDPVIPIPHHYVAYYRWIRDMFKANVIIHVGKHGSLEWLPGKSVGLSASCFPDITISDLPHIYLYLIDDPGEGTQAKRRSYCCLIDYLIPVMHNAGSYDDLAKITVQLKQYYYAKSTDPGKLTVLQKLIWEATVKANLNRDLKISEEEAFADFDGFLEHLHAYLNELSDTQIRDGLHVFGEPPTGFALEEFLAALTKLSNGNVPSLRQSIAELKGYDYDALLENRGLLRADGITNGEVLDELNSLSLELIKRFHAADFKQQAIDALLQEVLGSSNAKLQQCLTYVSSFLVPALEATTDELTNTLSASSGGYVPAGPSGAPTRGMADILPTGRNFYSVDPRAIPTNAAWKVGVSLGDALLKRYMQEDGKYPETVAMVVWATDCMRTTGDDVAEILYLMGIKPVWEASSGRVIGLEPIPFEILRRPRIDVTIRISGLFRDNFPNIVNLFDEAVALVADLKEGFEENYIVKHVENETAERVAQGADAQKAREEACYRIFGEKPGSYGAGVSDAIDSGNWKEKNDLANVYVTWGCYVYGGKNFGLTAPELFRHRLSKVDLTVKNWDMREHDALQSDDTYSYHAGMDVAIKAIAGKAARSYYGDSADPNRVKIRSTDEEIKYCFRSRLVNPKWTEGLKRHDYHGAAEFSRQFDYVLGWSATDDVIEDWMYEDMAEKFILDSEMQRWFEKVNPYALQNMTERLLEAIKRGLWDASDEMKQRLQQVYLQVEGLLEGANEKK